MRMKGLYRTINDGGTSWMCGTQSSSFWNKQQRQSRTFPKEETDYVVLDKTDIKHPVDRRVYRRAIKREARQMCRARCYCKWVSVFIFHLPTTTANFFVVFIPFGASM